VATAALFVVAGAAVAVVVLVSIRNERKSDDAPAVRSSKSTAAATRKSITTPLRRVVVPTSSTATGAKEEEAEGIEYFWQAPWKRPKGILFLAHGCAHSATDFWMPGGLPEEVKIVETALHVFQLAVVAVSSSNRRSKCWNTQVDAKRVAKVLHHLIGAPMTNVVGDHPPDPDLLRGLPLYAFGASSGGAFVSSDAFAAAIAEEISVMDVERGGSVSKGLSGYVCQIAAPRTPPPKGVSAVYITMGRDTRTQARVEKITATITQPHQHQEEQEQEHSSRVEHISVNPLPITDRFFADRIPYLLGDQFELSKQMRSALYDADLIDSDGYLHDDPRQEGEKWRTVLKSFADRIGDSLVPDESPLSEVMNVA